MNLMELMNQPLNGQLGNRLIELLDSPSYHTLNIVVAFAKNSGVLRVKDSLQRFRERGGKVNVYVGVDLGVTSYEALTALLLCTDSLNVVHAEKSQTFHSKIYQFLGEQMGMIVIGSHNLTGGGLWTNFESSAHITLDMSKLDDIELLKEQENYFQSLVSLNDSFMPIKTQEDVNNLLQNGYISKEVNQQVRSTKAAKSDGNSERLFGNGAPASLPRLSTPKNKTTDETPKENLTKEKSSGTVSTTQSDEGNTIWFESRAMTGGSRNILDLSKTSLLEHGEPTDIFYENNKPFISGGVKFFGLDPADTNQQKNITLNFEGVDYTGNTILYAENNGSWRLQIKGESSSKVGITEVFKRLNTAEGERYDANNELLLYLQFKIITFTKIQDDYYFMSVLPESELESFCEASKILARNGKSPQAKQLGLL